MSDDLMADGFLADGSVTEGFLTVSADRDRCCGSGNCAAVLPEVFEQDVDGIVVVRSARQPSSARPEITEAVLLCPVQAIAISELA